MKRSMHPEFWSLDSMYHRITGTRHDFLTANDGARYIEFLKPKGKTVLDVGASDGDSTLLFLKAGANRVLAVERDVKLASRIPFLSNIEIFNEPFNPQKHLLGLEWDCAKIDIEGYEALAVPYLKEVKRPIIVEVHSAILIEQFSENGFTLVTQPRRAPRGMDVCLMGRVTCR